MKTPRPRHYDKTPTVQYPDAVQPVTEGRTGPNFPYRGAETHGVDPRNDPYTRTTEILPEVEPVFSEPPPRIDPVPVIIHSSSSAEINTWHATQVPVNTNPAQIIGRDPQRKSVTLRNLSGTNTVYIGRQFGIDYNTGYPLDPQKDVTIHTTEEVWGISVDIQCLVAVLVESTVIPVNPEF